MWIYFTVRETKHLKRLSVRCGVEKYDSKILSISFRLICHSYHNIRSIWCYTGCQYWEYSLCHCHGNQRSPTSVILTQWAVKEREKIIQFPFNWSQKMFLSISWQKVRYNKAVYIYIHYIIIRHILYPLPRTAICALDWEVLTGSMYLHVWIILPPCGQADGVAQLNWSKKMWQ